MKPTVLGHGVLIAVLVGLLLVPGPLAAQGDDVPEVVKTLLAEGDRQRQAGRAEAAIASYEEARRLAPSVVEVYVSLGALYDAGGDLERALEVFTAGLEHDPDEPDLLFNAAVVSLRLGRAEEALGHVDRALEEGGRDANLHSLRSAVLRELGRLDDALAAQENAARLAPGDPQIQYRLGNLLYELGRTDDAVAAYRKAIKKDKGFLRAYYNLGAVLFDEGRYDEALAAYQVALEPVQQAFAAGQPVDAEHSRAFLNLGAIHFQRHEWDAALDAYGKALRLDPTQAGALYNQGFIYYETGRLDEAHDAYERALELDPSLPMAYLHLGRIAALRGRHAEAVRRLEQGLEQLRGEHRREALLALGESYRALGRPAEAVDAYRSVLAQEPDDLEALVTLGRLLRDQGDGAGARQLLERARKVAPENPGAALELAGLARAEGDPDREKALYEEILRRSGSAPEMWPVRVNLARVLVEQGSTAEARRIFESVVDRLPELVRDGLAERQGQVLATVHGLLLASAGDLAGARRRLRAVAGGQDPPLPARDAVAVLDALEGAPEAAAEALAATLAKHLETPFEDAARANLGQALWLAGRGREAREHLERAVRAFPGDPGLQLALGETAFGERDYPRAIEQLGAAVERCGSKAGEGPAAAAAAASRELRVTLGGSAPDALCARAAKSLATALVSAAYADLERARGDAAALDAAGRRAERALALPLTGEERAIAYLVRGTARLASGAAEGARADLVRALEDLPEGLSSLARNNLGVARYRLGEIDAARRELEQAEGGSAAAEATLNLGILLDEAAGDKTRALELYEAYLARGGRRSEEVRTWVERLRRVYR